MLTETSPCKYQVNASAAAACPSKGDPFSKSNANENRDAKNFGWVMLGARELGDGGGRGG